MGNRAAAATFLDGDVAETVIYNVALTETDRKLIEQHLAGKYAITLPY